MPAAAVIGSGPFVRVKQRDGDVEEYEAGGSDAYTAGEIISGFGSMVRCPAPAAHCSAA